MLLGKYSMGIGDRFRRQGKAQLRALELAAEQGVTIEPVWNKSHREHTITGTQPQSVRAEADAAVAAVGWTGSYYVDADHIGLGNVDLFISSSNFFTLDVADFTGKPAAGDSIDAFVKEHRSFAGSLKIPGIAESVEITQARIETIARTYLLAVQEAGKIYRHIETVKGAENFVTEVSMDETETPQTPVEMLFILAAIAREGIPAQTIAPKFTGRFNKGVDYAGDVAAFAKEFDEDLAVIAFAVREFGLPANLKLSIHSGSDKFSIYAPMKESLRRHDAGLHLKTAGTTWLEELIGLAMAGGDGLDIAKEIYRGALKRYHELCEPYKTVIDIDTDRLPSSDTVDGWSGEQYAATLRHDRSCPAYNPNLRQMLHVAYKLAAEMGERYTGAVEKHQETIAPNVIENIFDRHVKRVFV